MNILNNSCLNLIDDIRDNLRANHVLSNENLSRRQILIWLWQYRLQIILDEIASTGYIQGVYTDMLEGFELQPIWGSNNSAAGGSYMLESVRDLPKLLLLKNKSGILYVKDMQGNPIQLGGQLKAKFQKFRKYTCGDYIWYQYGQKLRVEGPDLIRFVDVAVVPDLSYTESDECDFYERPFPFPVDKIPMLKQLIYEKELGIRQSARPDEVNNSLDDTLKPLTK